MQEESDTARVEASSLASLVFLGTAGRILVYTVTIVLARLLAIEDFEDYVAAAALFTLLVAAAPLGSDKLALAIVPPFHRRNDWAGIHRFIRFVRRRSVVGLVCATSFGLAWSLATTSALSAEPKPGLTAMTVALAVLPIGVAAHVGFEIVTALGNMRRIALMFWVGVPGCTLSVIGLMHLFGDSLDARGAILAWGVGWALAASAAFVLFQSARSDPTDTAVPKTVPTDSERRSWARSGWLLWCYRVSIAISLSAGVLALDLFSLPPESVGAYASAAAITGLMSVLLTATNRDYGRATAIGLREGDRANLRTEFRRRLRWIGPASVGLYLLGLVFAEELLGAMGEEFVEFGVRPLAILSAAMVIEIILAPNVMLLKYSRRESSILAGAMIAVVVQLVLLARLAPDHGATGAAIALLIAVVSKHLWLSLAVQKPRLLALKDR